MPTVLIVDDDAKLLRMLQRTLTYEGFHVLSASNGNEALAELRAEAGCGRAGLADARPGRPAPG